MPLETEEEKAARQARLSKAMGALFLKDKVEKLEQDVEHLDFARGPPSGSGAGRGAGGRGMGRGRGRGRGGACGPGETGAHGEGAQDPRGHHEGRGAHQHRGGHRGHHHHAHGGHPHSAPRGPYYDLLGSEGAAKQDGRLGRMNTSVAIRILDASVLIYALRTVHEWLKRGEFRVVVPLEALNTLDVLKKGDEPINAAARKASRFLEERIGFEHPPLAGATSSHEAGAIPLRAGLVAQRDAERVSLADAQAARAVMMASDTSEADEVSATGSKTEGDNTDALGRAPASDAFELAHASVHLREMVCCALFFQQQQRMRERAHGQPGNERDAQAKDGAERHPEHQHQWSTVQSFAIAFAFPPSTGPFVYEVPVASAPGARFDVRADGRHSEMWARAFGLEPEIVPTANSWLHAAETRKEGRGAHHEGGQHHQHHHHHPNPPPHHHHQHDVRESVRDHDQQELYGQPRVQIARRNLPLDDKITPPPSSSPDGAERPRIIFA